MNECLFFKNDRCGILTTTQCSDSCKFKKTEKEFRAAQAKADAILASTGLERCIKHVGDTLIMSTRKKYEGLY